MTVDVEGFVGWLRARGTPEPNLELYRKGAELIAQHLDAPPLRPRHVEAALRAEEKSGASARRLANLHEVGQRLLEYTTLPKEEAPAPLPQGRPPLAGCTCREEQDIWIDADWGAWGTAAAAIAGVSGAAAMPVIGAYGASAIAFGVATLGGIVTTTSVCYRCQTCRQRIQRRSLDEEDRATLWQARIVVVGLTIFFALATILFAYLWKRRVDEAFGPEPVPEVEVNDFVEEDEEEVEE